MKRKGESRTTLWRRKVREREESSEECCQCQYHIQEEYGDHHAFAEQQSTSRGTESRHRSGTRGSKAAKLCCHVENAGQSQTFEGKLHLMEPYALLQDCTKGSHPDGSYPATESHLDAVHSQEQPEVDSEEGVDYGNADGQHAILSNFDDNPHPTAADGDDEVNISQISPILVSCNELHPNHKDAHDPKCLSDPDVNSVRDTVHHDPVPSDINYPGEPDHNDPDDPDPDEPGEPNPNNLDDSEPEELPGGPDPNDPDDPNPEDPDDPYQDDPDEPDPDEPDPDEPDPDEPDPDEPDPDEPDPDEPDPNDPDEPDPNDPGDLGPDDPDPEYPGAAGGDGPEEGNESNFSLASPLLNVVCLNLQNRSLREVLAVLLASSVRDSLSYDALLRLMKAFNCIFGSNYLPVDKKQLWDLLGRNNIGISKKVYCPNCLEGHGRLRDFNHELVCQCGNVLRKHSLKYFIVLDLRKQLKELFEKQHIREALNYRQERHVRIEGTMEDILDGREYRSLREHGNILSVDNNFSYTFNLDGFSLAKSSSLEAWPIFLRLNELPWNLRHKNIILAGVWVDLKQPNVNLFMEDFVEQGNILSNDGVVWTPGDGADEITSKIIPTVHVADSQARCKTLNIHSPSGYYSCPLCLHPGVYCGGAVHFPYWPPVVYPDRRTDEDIRACMMQAFDEGRPVRGYKGTAQIMLLDHMDLAKGITTEDMHPFSGVIEAHMNMLFTRTRDYVPPYYIGSQDHMSLINNRMFSIRTPICISRKPRSIKARKSWKSSEWKNWLLYYLVPCLDNILPRRYLQHLEKFAQAVFLVTRDIVSERDCDEAERLFREYVMEYEIIFGREHMTYNVHILLHVADCVREWGPTLAHSTSFFEDWNHDLVKTVTSPNAVTDQIVIRFLIKRFLANVEHDDTISEDIKKHVGFVLYNPRLRESVTIGDVVLLGRNESRAPNEREALVLAENNLNVAYMTIYRRAEYKGVEYRSSDYRYDGEETKSDCSYVYTWADEFSRITTVALVGNGENRRVMVFLDVLNTNIARNTYICHVADIPNILTLGTFANIRGPAIMCNTPTGPFIMPVVSVRELD